MEQAKEKDPKELKINPNEPVLTAGAEPESLLSGKASTLRGLASSSGWKALTGDMQSQINELINKLVSQETTDPKIAILQESIRTLNFVVNYPRATIERSRIDGVRKAQQVEFEEFQKSE